MVKKIKQIKKHDDRVNLKLTPKLGDELAYLSKVTGKTRIQILSEFLDSMLVCASSYRNFIYYVHIRGTEQITIDFIGNSKIISGSFKATSGFQAEELEKQIYNDALKVEKTSSFAQIESQLSKKRKKCKVVN